MQLLTALSAYINRTKIVSSIIIISTFGLSAMIATFMSKKLSQNSYCVDNEAEQILHPIAQKRKINNVKFHIDPTDTDNYTARPLINTICLPLNIKTTLLKGNILHKNRAIGFIHHELTHIQMNSALRILLATSIGVVAFSSTYDKLLEKYQQNIPTAYLIGFTASSAIGAYLTRLVYSKFDETWADDGIPNERELLEPQRSFYKNHHKDSMITIRLLKQKPLREALAEIPLSRFYTYPQQLAKYYIPKDYFNKSALLCDLVLHPTDPHPSNLFRAQRFKARIKALEEAEKNNNK